MLAAAASCDAARKRCTTLLLDDLTADADRAARALEAALGAPKKKKAWRTCYATQCHVNATAHRQDAAVRAGRPARVAMLRDLDARFLRGAFRDARPPASPFLFPVDTPSSRRTRRSRPSPRASPAI